jgi:hypothetical protein
MFTLAFLTVSLPLVYGAKQSIQSEMTSDLLTLADDCEEEADNPFANTTEEKTPNNIGSSLEEYLHENHALESYAFVLSTEYKIEHVSLYTAFFGDLISPPPDLS